MARPTTAVRPASSPGEPPRKAPTGTVIRPDIQALRALAVSLVLIYHLWPNRLSGGFIGVDVFFVISGFLITSHLLAHPPSRGRNLLEFWSRRVRRLLPAALLVLAATLVASRIVAPSTTWGNSAKDIRAAALYFVNWRFAAQSVNYLAAENPPSVVEHFWSLSVEEQFYLIWPVVILIVVGIARWRRWRLVPVTIGGLALVVAASLAYSIHETALDPARAYFVTPTRIWELGLGGLLAAALSSRALGRDRDSEAVPLPAAARVTLTWLGLAAIVWTAVVYTGTTPFPGYQALVPVLGTVAVIAATPPRAPGSPAAIMAWRPVQWLGDVSYSVYLWHWPMIVLVPYVSGEHLGRLDKLTIIVVTLVLAGLTKHYVEDRFRKPAWGRPLVKPYALGAALMTVVVVGALAQVAEAGHGAAPLAQVPAGPCVGAAALAPRAQCPDPTDRGPLWESPRQAGNDKSIAYGYPGHPATCFAHPPDYSLTVCHFGDPDAAVKVALVGNSHAAQWLPTLRVIAQREHWALDTYIATRCANAMNVLQIFPDVGHAGQCARWASESTTAITKGGYDLVVMSNRVSGPAQGRPSIAASQKQYAQGYLDVLKKFHAAGLTVVAIRDTPAPGTSIPDCLDEHSAQYAKCDFSRSHLPADPVVTAVDQLDAWPAVTAADLTKYICPKHAKCPSVVGRVPVYFDNSHMTGLFAMTLAPYLQPHLTNALQRVAAVKAVKAAVPASSKSGPVDCTGAAALANHCPRPTAGPLLQDPARAKKDLPAAWTDHCFAHNPSYTLVSPPCHYGPKHAKIRVALVGNSHAGEWLPALLPIAEQQHWSIDTYLAARCANALGILQVFGNQGHAAQCRTWAQQSTRAIINGHYDLVVMSNRVSGPAQGQATIAASQRAYERGYRAVLVKFRRAGLTVVGIQDTPAPGKDIPGGYKDIPSCLAAHADDLGFCDGPRAEWVWGDPLPAAARSLHDPKITTVNLTNDYVCPPRMARCPAVIGGLPVYRDNSHLARLFAASLAPYLKPYLMRALAG